MFIFNTLYLEDEFVKSLTIVKKNKVDSVLGPPVLMSILKVSVLGQKYYNKDKSFKSLLTVTLSKSFKFLSIKFLSSGEENILKIQVAE